MTRIRTAGFEAGGGRGYRSIFLAVFHASSICRFAATNSWTVMLMYGLLADAAARGRPRLAPAELLPLRYAAHRRF